MTMCLVLSTFTSSPVYVLATTKASVFFFVVCTLPHKFKTISQTRSWCVPLNFKPSWYT